ncbi:MAG: hypothetical protein V4610_11635 [Pseudomonadota bacterium]|jgi:hypothetical protein
MTYRQEERTMARASINWSSITLASVAAGPLFLLGLCLGTWADDPGKQLAIDLDGAAITGIPMLALVAAFFGTILTLPLNLLGASLMTWLGNRNDAARLPVMWAMAGALTCALSVAATGAGPASGHATSLVAFTFTGACCALVCRRRMQW